MSETLHDYPTLPLPLTPVEAEDLYDYEATIQRGLDTFYEVAAAFVHIKQRKLYRAEYRTFEDYCREKWHVDRSYADRMIEAAEVRENLAPIGTVLPEKESHARALSGLTPDQQRQVWPKVVATAPNGKVTAQHIKDVRQVEIPIPEPTPKIVFTTNHPISVFVPQEQPRTGPTVYESRHDWTCTDCQYHFDSALGFFYPSGRSICRACAVKSDPCAVCKSAHSNCPGCCEQCKRPCNVRQTCRLDVTPGDQPTEREPEAVITDELELEPADTLAPGIWYICNFCGKTTQQAYNAYKHGLHKASICRVCASKALHELQPATEAHVDELFQFYNTDRVKMVNAGLRVFRADDYACVIKEFNGTGWKLFEKYESKAALKRAIATWANSPNMIFENHL